MISGMAHAAVQINTCASFVIRGAFPTFNYGAHPSNIRLMFDGWAFVLCLSAEVSPPDVLRTQCE